jgi:hypothetical protein
VVGLVHWVGGWVFGGGVSREVVGLVWGILWGIGGWGGFGCEVVGLFLGLCKSPQQKHAKA